MYREGQLTIATDSPAYSPWFVNDDPTNGKGYESAVAYAVADELGFQSGDVEWVTVPFNASYQPGPKDFDFDINQISITPARAERVTFSRGYYSAAQAVVTAADSPFADATSLADLSDARFGVQVGTTSLDAVTNAILPRSESRKRTLVGSRPVWRSTTSLIRARSPATSSPEALIVQSVRPSGSMWV